MKKRQKYYLITAIVFTIIAVVHLIRGFAGWEANMGGVDIPLWVSWVAVVIAGYLAVRGYMHTSCRGLKCKICNH